MPYPHAMRLHGPWEYQPLSRWVCADGAWRETAADLPSPGRLHVPSDWGAALGADYRGRVCFTRRFGQPTGIDARERVWLVIEGADARGQAALNGQPLGEVRGYALPASFDVTDRLRPRNELTMVVETPPAIAGAGCLRPGRDDQPGGLVREVRLEVRHQNYVESLSAWTTQHECQPRLHVVVNVAGPDASLNLHVTGLRRELAFMPVRCGEKFTFELAAPGLPLWTPGQVNALELVEFRLLRGGEAVWEASRRVAVRQVDWDEASGTVAIQGGARREVRRLAHIPTDEQLDEFDAAGTPIVQRVPPSWAENVGARLAHHPSIVAWARPEAQITSE